MVAVQKCIWCKNVFDAEHFPKENVRKNIFDAKMHLMQKCI